MSPIPIGVVGTGSYLPARVRDNSEVAQLVGVPERWIEERTGILTRYVVAPDEASSDLAAGAAERALASAGIGADEVALIIVATSTPDELGPATACRVQAALGARRAVAMDVSGACSGYLFAARVAWDWLSMRPEDGYALVIGTEVFSKFINQEDRGTFVLFGDGAGATVFGAVPEGTGFRSIEIHSDGTQASDVLIPAGGSRRPADLSTVVEHGHQLQMNRRAVSAFIRDIFPRSVNELLARTGRKMSDIDLVVPHQPNPILLRTVALGMGIPEDRLFLIGDRIGNIGGACIPFALSEAAAADRIAPHDELLLAAFGAGLTWGTSFLGWSGVRNRPLSAFSIAPSRHTTGQLIPGESL